MRIGIDARFYGTMGKGLGRYTEQLIKHLEKIDSQDEYFVFLRRENFDAYVPQSPNFHKALADIPWYGITEQLIFPFILKKYNLDLVHFTHFNVPIFYRRPFVLTLHDLILFHFPTLRASTRFAPVYAFKYLVYRVVLRSAVLRSRHIFTVSRFTRDDILKHFNIPKEKITVTYESASRLVPATDGEVSANTETGEKLPPRAREKYGIMKPYFFYVGNAYPHKNLERLLRAFARLRKLDMQLVLAGKEDYFYFRLKRLVEKEKITSVIFTGEVSDTELGELYKNAVAYVFPSLYEGFGLPPLEAFSYGVPVVASGTTALPEVLGSATHYFNPESVESIAQSLRLIARDKELRDRLTREGYERLTRYSWDTLAQKTREGYGKAGALE